MALHALITSQFPRDYFGLVSFGRVAREVPPERLPEMSWDFEWGTNMQHALLLARQHAQPPDAARSRSSWSPTASRPPTSRTASRTSSTRRRRVTIEETLKEVMRCTRDGIRINTFMLDESYYLRRLRRADDEASTAAARSSRRPTPSATTCSSTSSSSAASTAARADAAAHRACATPRRRTHRSTATSARTAAAPVAATASCRCRPATEHGVKDAASTVR